MVLLARSGVAAQTGQRDIDPARVAESCSQRRHRGRCADAPSWCMIGRPVLAVTRGLDAGVWGQTEFQVNLKLGLTPRRPGEFAGGCLSDRCGAANPDWRRDHRSLVGPRRLGAEGDRTRPRRPLAAGPLTAVLPPADRCAKMVKYPVSSIRPEQRGIDQNSASGSHLGRSHGYPSSSSTSQKV